MLCAEFVCVCVCVCVFLCACRACTPPAPPHTLRSDRGGSRRNLPRVDLTLDKGRYLVVPLRLGQLGGALVRCNMVIYASKAVWLRGSYDVPVSNLRPVRACVRARAREACAWVRVLTLRNADDPPRSPPRGVVFVSQTCICR